MKPLVSCIAKSEFSLGLIKLSIISLNLFTDVWNFFTKCTPFLNRIWIKRRNKSFGSSRKSFHLTFHHYNDLNMTEGMKARVYSQFHGRKISCETKKILSARITRPISWYRQSHYVPLITPVIKSASQYWIISIWVLKDSLKGLSQIIST